MGSLGRSRLQTSTKWAILISAPSVSAAESCPFGLLQMAMPHFSESGPKELKGLATSQNLFRVKKRNSNSIRSRWVTGDDAQAWPWTRQASAPSPSNRAEVLSGSSGVFLMNSGRENVGVFSGSENASKVDPDPNQICENV